MAFDGHRQVCLKQHASCKAPYIRNSSHLRPHPVHSLSYPYVSLPRMVLVGVHLCLSLSASYRTGHTHLLLALQAGSISLHGIRNSIVYFYSSPKRLYLSSFLGAADVSHGYQGFLHGGLCTHPSATSLSANEAYSTEVVRLSTGQYGRLSGVVGSELHRCFRIRFTSPGRGVGYLPACAETRVRSVSQANTHRLPTSARTLLPPHQEL